MKKLENKTVFITGASAGIGKACAMAFAEEALIFFSQQEGLRD